MTNKILDALLMLFMALCLIKTGQLALEELNIPLPLAASVFTIAAYIVLIIICIRRPR